MILFDEAEDIFLRQDEDSWVVYFPERRSRLEFDDVNPDGYRKLA